MPIVAADIKFRLSGGAANSDPNASLGGAISTTEIVDAVIANLFDNVGGGEALDGDTEYRCFYVRNGHGSLSLQSTKIWLQSNTPSPDSTVEIGLGTSAVGGTEQTVADENTAPVSVTFSTAANEGAALNIGSIPAGQHKAIWIKRIISANAAAYNNDSAVIKLQGDTNA